MCKTKPNDKCINFEDVLFNCESLFENHPTLFAGPYDILKYSNLNGDEVKIPHLNLDYRYLCEIDKLIMPLNQIIMLKWYWLI